MRTAIVSDLHLGAASGEDLLRYPAMRQLLLAEIRDADRVVLLGDVVELRDLQIFAALDIARPFFEDLGKALAGREIVLVPGNHDHRLAGDVVDDPGVPLDEGLGLERSAEATSPPAKLIQRWLLPARLRIAYPGIWLRNDVYATHGHYMDAHLSLPRAECIAAAAMIRLLGSVPRSATPADYERILRPIYDFSFALAQSQQAGQRRSNRSRSEAAWQLLAGANDGSGKRSRVVGTAARAAFPGGVWTLNRLLKSDFKSTVSATAIFESGVEGACEMAARLELDRAHVIVGHTHRGGPYEGDGTWSLAERGSLHNTGSWFFAKAFHRAGTPPSGYWPGTVTWVDTTGPPQRRRLLIDHSHEEMTAMVRGATRR